VRAIAGSFESVWADIKFAAEFIGAGGTIGLLFEKSRNEIKEALDRRNATVQEANARYVELWKGNATQISDAIKAAQEASRVPFVGPPVPSRGRLDFAASAEKTSSAPKISEAQKYLEALQKTYEKTQELTVYEQLLFDIQEGRLGTVTPELERQLIAIAKTLDANKALAIEKEKQAALDEFIASAIERDAAAQERRNLELERQASAYLDLIDPMREFIRKLDEIDDLVSKGFLNSDQASEIKKQLGNIQKPFDEFSEYAKNAAQSAQQAFADFLFDPFKDGVDGMLKNFIKVLQRMAAEAIAAKLFEVLIGDYARTGNIGGVIGGATTPAAAPATSTATVKASSAPVVNVTNNFQGQQSPTDTTVIERRVRTAALDAVREAMSRNGAGVR
jgi:hypothetical protein